MTEGQKGIRNGEGNVYRKEKWDEEVQEEIMKEGKENIRHG